MDTKFLFLIGVMILILSTCSIDAAPAESGIEGQVMIVPVCPIVQDGEGCPDQPHQVALTVTSPKGQMIERFEIDEDGRFKDPLIPGQ
ncbi:MAG: hypothetical protein L0287_32665 [Anaerolineae bacterium]|nr:hypothetical protein [Anaerolineae bacterium]MCI0609037.1 hypothetical protein [Anaerolineae bacterium]